MQEARTEEGMEEGADRQQGAATARTRGTFYEIIYYIKELFCATILK